MAKRKPEDTPRTSPFGDIVPRITDRVTLRGEVKPRTEVGPRK
ncbi:hypothetical protein [Kibdelosporangium philippinense]|nr:hypothetical protein [Kibdelosporangium philippinense]